MSRDFKRETVLFYDYAADMTYEQVKSHYTTYFSQNGWRLASEKGPGWGPQYIEFMKDRFKVKVYDRNPGGVSYSIICMKSDPTDVEPVP